MAATKEQERKALEKIAAIIADLGAGSYLDITFKGVLEQAEENITNDWGSNYKEMWEDAKTEAETERREKNQIIVSLHGLEDQIEQMTEDIESERSRAKDDRQIARQYLEDLNKTLAERDVKQAEIEGLKAEIIELKAKLYDLMTK